MFLMNIGQIVHKFVICANFLYFQSSLNHDNNVNNEIVLLCINYLISVSFSSRDLIYQMFNQNIHYIVFLS